MTKWRHSSASRYRSFFQDESTPVRRSSKRWQQAKTTGANQKFRHPERSEGFGQILRCAQNDEAPTSPTPLFRHIQNTEHENWFQNPIGAIIDQSQTQF
jgi:hypothetical protein